MSTYNDNHVHHTIEFTGQHAHKVTNDMSEVKSGRVWFEAHLHTHREIEIMLQDKIIRLSRMQADIAIDAHNHESEHHEHCLLYTSDAADE